MISTVTSRNRPTTRLNRYQGKGAQTAIDEKWKRDEKNA